MRWFAKRGKPSDNNAPDTLALDPARMPGHVAIIMDGNGRWAQERGLPRVMGHREGMENVHRIVEMSDEWGIKVLTLYALSTENWVRPQEEVNALMALLVEYFHREIDELIRKHVKIRVIGAREGIPEAILTVLDDAQARSCDQEGMVLCVAFNYGGRRELADAAQAIARDVTQGRLALEQVDEDALTQRLYTAGLPDPDLVIRTSGERRTSNFLPFQTVYAEWCFSHVYWPDFDRREYHRALMEYQARSRRFGGVST